MSDINITVDSSQVAKGEQSLENLEAAFAKVVARISREERQLAKALKAPFETQQKAIDALVMDINGKYMTSVGKKITLMQNSQRAAEKQAAAEEKLTQELNKQAIAAQKAKSDTAFSLGMQRAQEEATALQQLNAAKDQAAAKEDMLRSKYDQSYVAMKIYKAEINSLNAALDMGILDAKQYGSAIDGLNSQLAGGTGIFSQFNVAANQAARQTNQVGVVVQQAGYQVGDFLVQVQSGTNWMVAFGQQATQLVGTLPLLAETLGVSAGRLIAISTGLGIAIPLITALGAAWMRTSEDTSKAEKAINSVDEALKSVQATTENMRLQGIAELMGISTDEVTLTERIAAAEKERLQTESSILEIKRNAVVAQGMYDILSAIDLNRQNKKQAALEDELKVIDDRLAKLRAEQFAHGKNNQMLAVQEAQYIAILRAATRTEVVTNKMAEAIDRGRIKAEGVKAAIDKFANTTVRVGVNFQASFSGFTGQAASWATGLYNEMESLATNPSYIPSSPRPQAAPNDVDFGMPALPSGGGGVGGGGSNRLESLIEELQTEKETLEIWYEESQTLLQTASDSELSILGGKNEAKLRLEQEYLEKLKGVLSQEKNYRLTEMGSMFGALADLAGVGGKKMLKVQATLSAAATTIAAYETAVKAAAEAKTIPGRIAAYAKFLATGLGAVKAIRSAGGIGGGGGASGGPSACSVSSSGGAPEPQTVFIDSLEPEGLYSGQTLINLFDAFYNENDRRGKVFVVGRG